MPTVARKHYANGLSSQRFARARKDMMLHGSVSQKDWQEANERQRDILHNIELTIKSVSEEELQQIHF